MSLDGLGSKLVPLIVTEDPISPEVGEKEVMVGACAEASPLYRKKIRQV